MRKKRAKLLLEKDARNRRQEQLEAAASLAKSTDGCCDDGCCDDVDDPPTEFYAIPQTDGPGDEKTGSGKSKKRKSEGNRAAVEEIGDIGN